MTLLQPDAAGNFGNPNPGKFSHFFSLDLPSSPDKEEEEEEEEGEWRGGRPSHCVHRQKCLTALIFGATFVAFLAAAAVTMAHMRREGDGGQSNKVGLEVCYVRASFFF